MSMPPDQMISTPGCILYADDESDDVFFFESAMRAAKLPFVLQSVPDGEQAIEYLSGKGAFADRSQFPFPVLVLLDINMPRRTGLEVLEWIRLRPMFKTLPVLIFTSSSRPEDMEESRELGANDYLVKPSNPKHLAELVKALHARWLSASIVVPQPQ